MTTDATARAYRMRSASALARAMMRLRDMHHDMTVGQVMALMLIADRPGITQRDIHTYLGTTDSASSRIVALLSEFGSRNTPGMELVEMRVNLQDRRERQCYLTPKGMRLVQDIQADIDRSYNQ